MSERAMEAHLNGEKPYSQWSKSELLDVLPASAVKQAQRLTLAELKAELLCNSSWHHTGRFYNRTLFYSIDVEAVNNLTLNKINKIIAQRHQFKKPSVQPRFVTAKIKFTEWVGRFKNYQRQVEREAIVQYMTTDKLVNIDGYKTKRLSSVTIIKKIEQKTKFADVKRLKIVNSCTEAVTECEEDKKC